MLVYDLFWGRSIITEFCPKDCGNQQKYQQNISQSRVFNLLELVRNLVAHGVAREGKWRGNWRMEWVASTLTPPPNVVYPALLKLMGTLRLPAVDWTDAPTDLNGLVRFGERRNLVSARVPSRSVRAILPKYSLNIEIGVGPEAVVYTRWQISNVTLSA